MSIVEQLGKGLPNHFNSTDYRTVKLAQMICDLLTETLKHLEAKLKGAPVEEKDPDKPTFKVSSYLDDGLCYEVIRQYCKCCEKAKSFWMGKRRHAIQSTFSAGFFWTFFRRVNQLELAKA